MNKPSLPFLIGLHGKAGAGKDTFASNAAQVYQYNTDSFAAVLKEATALLFKLDADDMINRHLKDRNHQYWGMSPRRMLQLLGTEAMRGTFGEDFWIKRLQLELYYSRRPVIITDVRFQNEVDFILKHGALVHITRDKNPYEAAAAGHASEAELEIPSVDNVWFARNNSGLLEFESCTYQIMDSIIAQFNLPKY